MADAICKKKCNQLYNYKNNLQYSQRKATGNYNSPDTRMTEIFYTQTKNLIIMVHSALLPQQI